jgi:capsular polysaccharide transport system permease protein
MTPVASLTVHAPPGRDAGRAQRPKAPHRMIVPVPQTPSGPQRSFASARAVSALMLREMYSTYGRSVGGFLWAVIEPAAGIAVLSLIFSLGFRSPPIGTNFAIFYASGLLPYMMFTSLAGKISGALNFSKQLLVYPSVTFVDAIVARFLLNLMTQLMVTYIVLAGILLTFDTRTVLEPLWIAEGLALAAVFALGVGTVNAYLFTRFPDWQYFWSILTRPLLILSCVIFMYDNVPQPFQGILWFNPLVHAVGAMRAGFYPNYRVDYVSPVYVLAVSVTLILIGLLLLRRFHRDLLHE